MQKKLYHKPNKKPNTKCPGCGFEIHYSHDFEMVLSGRYDNPEGGSYVAIRSTPVRQSGIESDVLVPAAQSLVWAIAVTLPSVSVAMFMRWEWSAPLFIGATTVLVSWISAMKRAEFALMKTEEFAFTPLASDETPSSGSEKGPLRLEVIHEEASGIRSRMQLMEIGGHVDEGKFSQFLVGIAAGRSTARKNWTPSSKLFSKEDYEEIINKLVLAEVLERTKSGSTRLTQNGKRSIMAMRRGGII